MPENVFDQLAALNTDALGDAATKQKNASSRKTKRNTTKRPRKNKSWRWILNVRREKHTNKKNKWANSIICKGKESTKHGTAGTNLGASIYQGWRTTKTQGGCGIRTWLCFWIHHPQSLKGVKKLSAKSFYSEICWRTTPKCPNSPETKRKVYKKKGKER